MRASQGQQTIAEQILRLFDSRRKNRSSETRAEHRRYRACHPASSRSSFERRHGLPASLGQVSYPNSPGCGMVWKTQASLPVMTSKARIIAGRRFVFAARCRSEDDQVLKDVSGRVVLNARQRFRIAIEADPQIRAAIFTERWNRLAGARVDGHQIAIDAVQKTTVGAVVAFPIIDAASGDGSRVVGMNPDLAARGGVQRNNGVVLGLNIP